MSKQWRDYAGRLWTWESASMRVLCDGRFVALAQSVTEAHAVARGF